MTALLPENASSTDSAIRLAVCHPIQLLCSKILPDWLNKAEQKPCIPAGVTMVQHHNSRPRSPPQRHMKLLRVRRSPRAVPEGPLGDFERRILI